MKILQINNNHMIMGGADRVYINTGELLQSFGHEITYFSTLDPDNITSESEKYFIPRSDNRSAGLFRRIIGTWRYLYNSNAKKNLERLILERKPDVAHLHLFYGMLSASILLVLKKHKIPIVLSIHDYRLICPANALLDSKHRICEKCRNRFYINCLVYKCSGGNFFFSAVLALEAYIRKYFIPPLHYIDKFIFVSQFSLLKHCEFDKRYSIKAVQLYNFNSLSASNRITVRGDYILFFGRLSIEKGLTTLVKAVRGLEIKLIIAGSGPLEGFVKSSLRDNSNIEYVGHIDGLELLDLIRNASYIVVPSEWYENNPMTIIEAQSSGKPVIASDIGGIPEIVVDGVSGFLFKQGSVESLRSTIVKATNCADQIYDRLCKGAQSFANNNYSSSKHYETLISLYETLMIKR